jgi:hypothetical protein
MSWTVFSFVDTRKGSKGASVAPVTLSSIFPLQSQGGLIPSKGRKKSFAAPSSGNDSHLAAPTDLGRLVQLNLHRPCESITPNLLVHRNEYIQYDVIPLGTTRCHCAIFTSDGPLLIMFPWSQTVICRVGYGLLRYSAATI